MIIRLAVKACAALCLVSGIAGPVPASADVGRLFFTPAERAAFESARRAAETALVVGPIEADPEVTVDLIEAAPDEPRPTITLDGYVRRSNGRATLWINGENSYDGDLSAARIDPLTARVSGGEVSVTPMDGEAPILLKPGQTYDPNSAVITDVYEKPVVLDEFAEY